MWKLRPVLNCAEFILVLYFHPGKQEFRFRGVCNLPAVGRPGLCLSICVLDRPCVSAYLFDITIHCWSTVQILRCRSCPAPNIKYTSVASSPTRPIPSLVSQVRSWEACQQERSETPGFSHMLDLRYCGRRQYRRTWPTTMHAVSLFTH